MMMPEIIWDTHELNKKLGAKRPMTAVEAICSVLASFGLTTIRKLKRGQYRPLVFAALLVGLCQPGEAQEAQRAGPSTLSGGAVTLFQNVRIFDGKSRTLSGPRNVLVRGNQIERISTDPIPTDRSATTVLIDGAGRTLMPGLIDAHWHTMLVRPTPAALLAGDIGHLNLVAGAEATATLMRGFTTVRDMGGPAFGLKRAIDEGTVAAAHLPVRRHHHRHKRSRRLPPAVEVPRILGSPQSRGEQTGAAMIADSPDEVRVRVREQLMLGASQIKLTAGGGVASPHSPLDASTFTEAELRAAVKPPRIGAPTSRCTCTRPPRSSARSPPA